MHSRSIHQFYVCLSLFRDYDFMTVASLSFFKDMNYFLSTHLSFEVRLKIILGKTWQCISQKIQSLHTSNSNIIQTLYSPAKFSMVVYHFNWTLHLSNEKFFRIVIISIAYKNVIYQKSTTVTIWKLYHWIQQFLRKYPPFRHS